MQPIYLFADSQMLFWREHGRLFLDSIRQLLPAEAPKAAYVGASNGDVPEFYGIFVAAMEGAGITDCRMILSSFSGEDAQYLAQADLILLAGGDPELGWRTLQNSGMMEAIAMRVRAGAVLIGVSAGAMQCGQFGWTEKGASSRELFNTFALVPFLIAVHGERGGWQDLVDILGLLNTSSVEALGIPSGGGVIYHPDNTVEPLRHPVERFKAAETGNRIVKSILLPT
jgi:peptidase E